MPTSDDAPEDDGVDAKDRGGSGNNSGAKRPAKLSTREIMVKGSIICAIITVPSLVVFVVIWIILDDVMIGAIAAVIIHFVGLGLSFKMAPRLLGMPSAGASGGGKSSSQAGGGE